MEVAKAAAIAWRQGHENTGSIRFSLLIVDREGGRMNMSLERAHEILTFWKLGVEIFPYRVINMALYLTGDLAAPA